MKFLGGKFRIAKQLGSFLNSEINRLKPEKYIEPFCGSCWVTCQIQSTIPRTASDVHKDLILMWQELQSGKFNPPDTISEAEYNKLKTEPSSALRGMVGFGCSFGGKWFAGYARDPSSDRNYCKEAKNSILKQLPKLKNVIFKNCSYKDIPIDKLENRLIYCDIPYFGTTGYKDTPEFDHNHFWEWVRQASLKNHVYISEYIAPSDFEVVWQIETRTDLEISSGGKAKRIEKLFKYKTQIFEISQKTT